MKIYLLKNFLSVLFQVLPRGWRNYRSNSDRNWRHKNPKMFRHSDSVILFMEPRNRFRQAGNWFLGSLKGLQIRALNLRSFLFIYLFLRVFPPPPSKRNWRHKNPKMFRHSDKNTGYRKTGDRKTGAGRQALGRQATGRQTAGRQADRPQADRRQADPGWTSRIIFPRAYKH
jgi:hypothetical protein